MNPALKPHVESFIEQEQLPAEYFNTVEKWFLPMVDEILYKISSHQGTYAIGISGCQGSGKSTLASLLVMMLNKMLGLRCINLSIDDFYLTHEERQALGKSTHPLLATRGVPGTHDVDLAIKTISSLQNSAETAVPRFDKALDDRMPADQWPKIRGPVDVIVLEGWCVSVTAQPNELLEEPTNELETLEDADGTWRHYVNDAMSGKYQELYALLDYLVFLKAPDFAKVFEWRQNQENRLQEKYASENSSNEIDNRIMSPIQLRRFIQHYERVTRHGLETLGDKGDVVFQLTDKQTIDQRLK